ncbi:MAG: alpha-galactosidase [Clostridia bacterium]|nr:alpha-galactosidase [Clostridia bacterium]
MLYVCFKRWSAAWDEEKHAFSIFYDGIGPVARDIRFESIEYLEGNKDLPCQYPPSAQKLARGIAVKYAGDDINRRDITFTLNLTDDGPALSFGCDGAANVLLRGYLPMGHGKAEDRMAVRLDGRDDILRSSVGPSSLKHCNSLFAADLDAALSLHSLGEERIYFDWKENCYAFSYETSKRDYSKRLDFKLTENLYRNRFHVDYKPLGPAARRDIPVGWMSWYAVQFRAGEKTVLDNARFQKAHLSRYGANTIWVDWEWYHRNHCGMETPGTDMFHPDQGAYPNGLKYVADEIKKMGFMPALWIGPTCDSAYNEALEQHPDMMMIHKAFWSGQYFLDPSHPAFLNEVLPRTIGLMKEWGYEALKWDVNPDTATFCDQCHEKLYDPSLSTRQMLKNAYAKVRQLVGDDTYMLYCSGAGMREEDHAVGSFDAMRIGGDIFGWDDFSRRCMDRIYDTYMLHNTTILCDADNVVIRDEFNDMNQARTRASLISLLGLPYTFGDDLPRLQKERVEILQKTIPPLPARPMEIRRFQRQSPQGVIHVRVEKEFLSYDLADFYNGTEEKTVYRFDPARELQKEKDEKFHAYDFWRDEYLGVIDGESPLELEAFESRVLALHQVANHPQLISTSRHVSQGAVELKNLSWNAETGVLSGVSSLPEDEKYTLVVAAPEGWHLAGQGEEIAPRVWKIHLATQAAGDFNWKVGFLRK